jgi:hypothetical protein
MEQFIKGYGVYSLKLFYFYNSNYKLKIVKCTLVIIQLFIGSTIFAQVGTRTIIPGTKCSMEMEEGFQLASRFNGLENIALNANILVSHLLSPVAKNLATVGSDEMKARGFILMSKREVKLQSGPAMLFVVNHENKGVLYKKLFLIFGDSVKTVFIDAMAPDSNAVLCKQVERIVLSTIYDPNLLEDPFSTLDFTMKIDTSIFKVAKNSASKIIFTNGEGTTPAFLSFSVATQKLKAKPEVKSTFAESKLKALNNNDSIISSTIESIKIDGLEGFLMKSSTLGKTKKLSYNYQVFLFGKNDDYYIMVGRSLNSIETCVKEFEVIVNSFKLKQ